MKESLSVRDLHVATAEKELIHGVDFDVKAGETVVILGPNGAGKSTLARAIASDDYVCVGDVRFSGKNVVKLTIDERARAGMFLSFQEPVTIPGLSLSEMLRSALEARDEKMSLREFSLRLTTCLEKLELNPTVAKRDLNVDFSGGEKKKLEIAQLLMLRPKLAILDEIDSGLDVDAARKVSQVLHDFQQETQAGLLIITHNMRILQALNVDHVLVLADGRIAKTGGAELLDEIKKHGFKNV